MLSIPFNPFTWDRTNERVHSDVLTLDLKDDKRKNVKVSQLSSDIFIKIPLKDQVNAVESSRGDGVTSAPLLEPILRSHFALAFFARI